MIKIYSNIIPFKWFMAMTVWPLLFIRKSAAYNFNETDERHEEIHGEQQKELLLVGFYVLYSLFFLFLLVKHRNWDKAYRANPFEREEYFYDGDEGYPNRRHHFSWIKLRENDEVCRNK